MEEDDLFDKVCEAMDSPSFDVLFSPEEREVLGLYVDFYPKWLDSLKKYTPLFLETQKIMLSSRGN